MAGQANLEKLVKGANPVKVYHTLRRFSAGPVSESRLSLHFDEKPWAPEK